MYNVSHLIHSIFIIYDTGYIIIMVCCHNGFISAACSVIEMNSIVGRCCRVFSPLSHPNTPGQQLSAPLSTLLSQGISDQSGSVVESRLLIPHSAPIQPAATVNLTLDNVMSLRPLQATAGQDDALTLPCDGTMPCVHYLPTPLTVSTTDHPALPQ